MDVSQRHTVFPAAGPDGEHPAIHLARHGTDLPSRDDEIEDRLGDVLDLVSRLIGRFAHTRIMPGIRTGRQPVLPSCGGLRWSSQHFLN
jgi:hypothetical protein